MVDVLDQIDLVWVVGKCCIGVMVGVLVFEVFVQVVIVWLCEFGVCNVCVFDGIEENVLFLLLCGLNLLFVV